MATTKPDKSHSLSVGEMLAHTAEAMTMSSDPAKRAAAQEWLKIINRRLANLQHAPLAKAA